jgi:mono/diheme cytochrome c family protein
MQGVFASLAGSFLWASALADAGPPPDFERDIVPLFARHCQECHGASKTEAGLRLDKRSAMLAGGESGSPGIVPAKPAESTIIQRITSTDKDVVMPPKGPRLSPEEIATLTRWIEAGALGPDDGAARADTSKHWAFLNPSRPGIPSPVTPHWSSGPVDAFVLQRIEEKSLSPSPAADRGKWLRRATLDLIGTAPTIAELDGFLADDRPDAVERQVDRLLSSPHFGERWGRLWLDAARYADSNGYEKDRRRNAWVYRDWVVKSINADLPYDQFLIEQIAGDLLEGASQDQIVATGFLRNSMVNEEGAIDPEQFRMEAMFDRMDAIGKSILGLTIQCTQCHNHKFDPMSQEEYYQLFAFINNAYEARPATFSDAGREQIARIESAVADIETKLQQSVPDWSDRLKAWESTVLASQFDWQILKASECLDPGGGTKYERLDDESWIGGGYAPANVTTRYVAQTSLSKVTGLRLELLTHPNLPARGPGRSDDGSWRLSELVVTAEPLDGSAQPVGVKLVKGSADAGLTDQPYGPEQKLRVGPVAFAFDGKNETAWSADNGPARQHQDRTAVFEFEKPIEFAGGVRLVITMIQAHGRLDPEIDNNSEIGRFRFSITSADQPAQAPVIPRKVLLAARVPAEARTASDQRTLFGFYRTTVSEWSDANNEIERLIDGWPKPTPTLALEERAVPRTTAVLKRGDWLKPTKPVVPGTPAFLHALPADAPPTRLTFARWLADRSSPTTARVIVNRVWQGYFGTGLVATPEDFGTQSELPTHPELLDWLACDLMENDWHLKSIHRAIATSSLYQQSSTLDAARLDADPTNKWLARGPRLRVDAELVRDVVLSASGLLHEQSGGPGVFPPAPAFLFVPPASYESFTWREETGSNRYRRSLYTFRRRSTPYPMLAAFDAPAGDASCVRRQRSNTPVQALVTLNEPVFFEAAQALADDVVRQSSSSSPDVAGQIFRKATGRVPTPAELDILMKLFQQQKQRFAEGWIDPKQIAFADPARAQTVPAGFTPTEMGAWTVVARAVLNLDEVITKE